ncbi:MAG: hypothetical protein COV98_00180 [Candidatus Altarchaeum sp. CG12_big_fil_rev_8_21_14_0_65_33_22]|nr:MAG: hypothetical protein AUK59_01050 [Candidatus Altarchaeum sp. CG2_30_32_3053]PIN68180.1 MAG: hypothetical protein COV98_00180 [Candidatus Altarchaeum sp. CG12_big_fil_rev_8_21_14_0_65_33_22]PIZ32971.1 MAG: hypothetical protein COY41_00410 [Candidatus Altarchaeum sp. CG_4_10_14_0_8_um_filter_32_851]PJC13979.1 MAG: hypothetical protein CO063_03300 [Candidatus Altarchaeum sp. CG_4_9_14_0_8_um_filter_32_206]
MKIAYISYLGQEIVKRWAEWFAKRGHEVYLVLPAHTTKVQAEFKGVHIHKVNIQSYASKIFPFPTIWSGVLPCRKVINEIKPDIVHGQNVIESGLPVVFSGDYPKIVSILGNEPFLELIVYRLLVKTVFWRVNAIHSFAENLTEKTISLGVNKPKIFTIRPCADTKKYNPYLDGFDLKKSLNFENNPLVISTRNLWPGYNVECLIESVPYVIKEIPNAKFMIKMGHIIPEERVEKFKNLVKNLKISNRVKFIGYVPYNDLPKYLACADVYVSTSLFDGLGISNIEALACGTPAVLADIDSTRNLIKKGLHARLYPPKDSKALAKEIIASIKNKEKENKEIHKENFEIIKEHYDFDKNMEKVEKLYENLIDKYKKHK